MVSAFLEAAQRENRLFERFPARFPAKYKYSANDYGTEVFLRDVSAQGMKFASRQRLFLHDSVSLQVEIPGSREPLELNGRVVWTQTQAADLWDIGIEFHKINLMRLHRIFRAARPEDE